MPPQPTNFSTSDLVPLFRTLAVAPALMIISFADINPNRSKLPDEHKGHTTYGKHNKTTQSEVT